MLKGSLATLALIAVSLGFAAGARAASTPERIVFDGNVLWHNSQDGITPLPWDNFSGPCTLGTAFTYTVTQLGTTFFTHNRTDIDPKLVDPFNQLNPRFDPQLNSPLLCKYVGDAVVLDAHSLDIGVVHRALDHADERRRPQRYRRSTEGGDDARTAAV